MTPPFVRSPYNYDVELASNESAYTETMPSLTVQSQSDDADLNLMMKRFGLGAPLPLDARMPRYGDFTHLTDFRSALDAINSAEESFMQFPAEIRAQFENNPQLFLDFCENPANITTLKQWFPKENLNVSVSGSSSEQSAVRSGSDRGAAQADNEVRAAVAPGGGGSGGASGG